MRFTDDYEIHVSGLAGVFCAQLLILVTAIIVAYM